MKSAKQKPSRVPHTKPEVFILESLTLDDERDDLQDGLLLYRSLQLYGKRPEYYYFRTEKELKELAEVFEQSHYRYLHLSCHGSSTEIATTFDELTYARFASIFSGKLNNKRLFASACSLGNEQLPIAVKAKNGGLYSVLAPSTPIAFDRSAAFWAAFYFLMFDLDSQRMKLGTMKTRLVAISELFNVNLHLTWNSAHEKKLMSMEFSAKNGIEHEKTKDYAND